MHCGIPARLGIYKALETDFSEDDAGNLLEKLVVQSKLDSVWFIFLSHALGARIVASIFPNPGLSFFKDGIDCVIEDRFDPDEIESLVSKLRVRFPSAISRFGVAVDEIIEESLPILRLAVEAENEGDVRGLWQGINKV